MFGFRRLIMPAKLIGLSLGLCGLAPSMAHAACSTADPPGNSADPSTLIWTTAAGAPDDQAIQSYYTMARAAEGCGTPMVLPTGYDTMTPAQQELWLFNSEREVRGEPDLQLDSTLMSQVAVNHGLEIAQYGYFDHASPINVPSWGSPYVGLPRMSINPVFANDTFEEDLDGGPGNPAATVYSYMYFDGAGSANLACTTLVTWGCWGHRHAILNATLNWIGIGFVNMPGTLYGGSTTNGFGTVHAGYTPPATADTGSPVMGAITYVNGTATVTGVADNPTNVNDTGPTPLTAGVTGVVFYTNNIVETGGFQGTFNTVAATQNPDGSWSAQITVNPGDVLHAVAVDGSGNFTDMAMAPPAVTLAAGANTVALPAAATPTTPAMTVRSSVATIGSGWTPAVTPSASALVASIDRQAGHEVVRSVRVFLGGRYRIYTPGKSADFPLYTSEGVVVTLTAKVRWRSTTHQELFTVPTVHLRRGWNFVAVPYPVTGMTCHAVRFELANLGDRLEQITVGPSPTQGVIMRPIHGRWGNDLTKHIPYSKGFWIKGAGQATWTPSPTQYTRRAPAIA